MMQMVQNGEHGNLEEEEGAMGEVIQAKNIDIDDFVLPDFLPALQNQVNTPNQSSLNRNLNINWAFSQFGAPGQADPRRLAFMEGKMGQHKTNTPQMCTGFGPNSSPQWAVQHK
jgi:hypothetical protein